MLSCGRGGSSNSSNSRASKPVYHYVEPEQNIAEIFWDCLKTQHPKVRPAFEAAKALEEYAYDQEEDVTEFFSKTHMIYDYFIPRGSEEDDNMLVARFELQCYQTFDNSWMGIVTANAFGYQLKKEDCHCEVFAVEYKDGILTDRDINTLFPEFFRTATRYFINGHYTCLVFANESVTFSNDDYWPVKYNWNGKTFEQDPESVIMVNSIGRYSGQFLNWYSVGDKPRDLDENNDVVDDEEVLAHFVVENGIVSEYTLQHPICGFAQREEYLDGNWEITSKPVAIGFPIQNVLDYEKDSTMLKDVTIVTDYRDGQYMITQQLCHNKNLGVDIFIEFTAEDEQSDIENIRVYSKPIVITAASEVEDCEAIKPKAKSIFRALGFDVNNPELGVFERVCGMGNGFFIVYKGAVKELHFQTYEANDGSTLVLLVTLKAHGSVLDVHYWSYKDGTFEETDLGLIPSNADYVNIDETGFNYHRPTAPNEDPDAFWINTYDWNGDTFELESSMDFGETN